MIDAEQIIGKKDKRILMLASISHKKGPMLMVHAFHAIHEYDSSFTLHIIGDVADPRFAIFLDHSIATLGLQNSVEYYGKLEHEIVEELLPHFSFVLSTSPIEGMPYNILESLQKGLTPLVYNWVGAEGLYPRSYIWTDIPGLVKMVDGHVKNPPDPEKYKKFVKENYSQELQFEKLDKIVEDLLKDVENKPKIEKNGTVSAVIAVRNGEKTIKRAIQSLQNQTKPLKKIIVVDDVSTDDTAVIVQSIAERSPIPIQIIQNTSNQWVFASRNIGCDHVDSDYIMFLDADDWVEENYVESLSKVFDENDAISVVYPDMVYFDEKNEKIFNQPEFSAQTLSKYNFIAYSAMQRTASFKKIGGFSEHMNDCRNHLTEWALWLDYVKAGFGIKRFPSPLFHYFHDDSADQMSSGYERSRDDMQLELALHLSDNHNEILMTGKKKRIVLVCQGKDYLDHSKVGFELMTWYKPLEEFGDVFVFQYDVEMKHYGKSAMQDRLRAFVNLIKPDYVFHPTYKADVLPIIWAELSAFYNTIAWNSDDDRRYDDFTRDYCRNFKYSITTYEHIYNRMTHQGRILSQWGANQFYFKPIIDTKLLQSNTWKAKTIDVSFVGQRHTNRLDMLGGLPIEKYGSGWDSGFVDFKEVGKIIASSKISIAPSMGVAGRQLKLRPFEIAACGTLCLCEQMQGIEEYFVPDEEIVLFDTREELKEKIQYYLEHNEERTAIAQAGYQRTVKDHLWSNRLKTIFKIIDRGAK